VGVGDELPSVRGFSSVSSHPLPQMMGDITDTCIYVGDQQKHVCALRERCLV
jgi:hypothetical protein